MRLKEIGLIGSVVLLAACGGGGGKKVYFGNLADGANLESPFKVQMKAENLIVEPAALGVNDGHGHFHILVDEPLAASSGPIPKDAQHIHYGDGQTETTLDLPVGKHTLILEFAKGDHVPYDPPIYQQVTINVTKQNAPVAPAAADSTAAKADTTKAPKADSAKTDTATAKPTTGSGAGAKKAAPKQKAK
jgi:hypothetical protein